MDIQNLSERDRAVLRSIFDPTATLGDVVEEGDTFEHEEDVTSDDERRAADLCAAGVAMAEGNRLEEALRLLDEGVAAAPGRAAAYNDRAQLYRLLKRDTEAMSDLNMAVKLTVGKRSRARALALCQRGVLLRKLGKAEEARTDFTEAAKLGSSFARKQVVEMNPYAAMCNQMLSQVMQGNKDIQL